MRVSEIGVSFRPGCWEVHALVSSDARMEPLFLWYRFPEELSGLISADSGNALAAALLLPAMRHGEPIELPVPVSPKLMRSIQRIQMIYRAWDPTLSIIAVNAPLLEDARPTGREIGLFFSSGVDSFYSLARNTIDHPLNEDVITELIMVQGFDTEVQQGRSDVFETMLANAHKIGHQLGKSVIGVATNVKDIMSALGYPRGLLGHGAALASVGLFLEDVFAKLYIAAADSYVYLPPSATHPILDPLWSTERCSFVHDGCEATRLEKTRFIARFQYAMDALRVCWNKESWSKENPEINCGRCSKCLRTMVGLHLAGALERCRTLPNTIDVAALQKIPFRDYYDELPFFQEMLEELERSDSDADVSIRAALTKGLEAPRGYFDFLERAKKAIDRLVPLRDRFILVDRDTIRWRLGAGRNIYPFLERDGEYFGQPKDDETAICELERLRDAGAKFMVFWWADHWWLEYYAGLGHYLRANYRCLLEDDSLIVFDLRRPSEISQG
jgi:hypothetical protein